MWIKKHRGFANHECTMAYETTKRTAPYNLVAPVFFSLANLERCCVRHTSTGTDTPYQSAVLVAISSVEIVWNGVPLTCVYPFDTDMGTDTYLHRHLRLVCNPILAILSLLPSVHHYDHVVDKNGHWRWSCGCGCGDRERDRERERASDTHTHESP